MIPIVVWQPNETASQVMRYLIEGSCVVLPTESTYVAVASALNASTLARLNEDCQAAIALLDYPDRLDWLPRIGALESRLLRKLGPGPVILHSDGGFQSGLACRLPAGTQAMVLREGRLAVRWPAHPIWPELRRAGIPLVTASLTGAFTAEDASRQVGAGVTCVVDGGPTEYSANPTVVRREGRRCRVVGAGLLTQDQIDALTVCRILFVCTGNTCRSPLAESLCKKLLANHFGVTPEELPSIGFLVQSAGLGAMIGAPASAEGIAVAQELGADLTQHRSKMINVDLLQWADHIFGLTAGHCGTLDGIHLEGMPMPRLLSPRAADIVDPIGGQMADYRTCAHAILECLTERLPELLES